MTLAACGPDETISGYTNPEAAYHLVTIDGVPFPAEATIRLPEKGVINGQAPCNSYSATQTQFYPWFEATQITTTRSICAEQEAETAFLTALEDMSFAEVSGDILLLTGEGGREMTFKTH